MTVHRSWYHAKKHLGQNFLIDPNQLSRLVEALDLRAKDRVIEIGPGTGLLSERIQPLVRKLWAIEIDRDLAGQLQRTFSDADNVEIIQADILETDLIALCGTEAARVIGNIPYYITTPIIFHVLDHSGPIQDMTLLIQK
ncbi:16S rRNA (adenine(1518)-N(6)/adenine(1519)-N(6))-dimethyltransferase, partial [bacterium]|nr:16S rRNA (adenine(1518)-N(6)/adenine(1519)-N(6))-dimethyltransferase [bacterium]